MAVSTYVQRIWGVFTNPGNQLLGITSGEVSTNLLSGTTAGTAYYAAESGVSGINSGSRDDAPLLQAAYTAAVASGANALILPQGDVYISGLSADTIYYGFSHNSGSGAPTEGITYLNSGVRISNYTTIWLMTNGQVMDGASVPIMPPAYDYRFQRSVATSGTVTANVGINNLTLEIAGTGSTITSLTVVFPTAPSDGQLFTLRAAVAVTTLTVTGTVVASPAGALAAGYSRTFLYDNTAATWI